MEAVVNINWTTWNSH